MCVRTFGSLINSDCSRCCCFLRHLLIAQPKNKSCNGVRGLPRLPFLFHLGSINKPRRFDCDCEQVYVLQLHRIFKMRIVLAAGCHLADRARPTYPLFSSIFHSPTTHLVLRTVCRQLQLVGREEDLYLVVLCAPWSER